MSASGTGQGGSMPGCLWAILNLVWIGLLGAGMYYGFTSWRLTQGGEANGSVVQMISSEDSDGGVTYAPVIEYRVQGRTYTYKSSNYTNPPAYHMGQQVEMVYDPAHPDQARINTFFELWLVPILLVPCGLGSGGLTIFSMFVMLRRRTARQG
jgi:hypothetical protein